MYYANTRRSKLQKVGAFLEKRAARDVWRGKIGYVGIEVVSGGADTVVFGKTKMGGMLTPSG